MKNRALQSSQHAPSASAADPRGRSSLMGFTMIELLVTIGIFLVLTSVVLAKYRSFETHAVFANSVENLVFALRQAQVYGSGTKGHTAACPSGSGSSFGCAYGVHLPQANPPYARIFVDLNDNHKYDGPTEDIDTLGFDSSISYAGPFSCGGIPCTGDSVDITFKRPNPDAYIVDSTGSGIGGPYDLVLMKINSTRTADTATVTVTSAGQISVQ